MNTIINKRMNKKGFTLAELMLTVAIIIILGALAMVGVTRYLRGLRLLEMDNAAREIFYAAQNRITAELNSGTLGRLDPSSQMKTDISAAGTKQMKDSVGNNVGYVVVFPDATDKTKVLDVDDPLDATLWDELLPFGSIDDTLRLGGSYIINYSYDPDANMATVLDVWFASDEGSGFFRNWNGSEAALLEATYGELDAARKDKSDRRNFKGDAVIGYYGSDTVTALNELYNFHNLSFELINDEVLYGEFSFQAKRLRSSELELQQGNLDGLNPQLKITITGEKSRAQKTLRYDTTTKNLYPFNSKDPLSISVVKDVTETNSSKFEFQIVLDDITETVGERFRDLVATPDSGVFIPGEDIRVNVEVYTNDKLANIGSVTAMDNSLFQYVKSTKDAGTTTTEAGIGKIRHLQNLSSEVSGVDYEKEETKINKALQTDDLTWKVEDNDHKIIGGFLNFSIDGTTKLSGKIVYNDSTDTKQTNISFHPINMSTALVYEAGYKDNAGKDKRHTINNLVVSGSEHVHAGLFGTVSTPTGAAMPHGDILLTVQNLEMNGASITGVQTAGAIIANEVNAARLSNITISAAAVTTSNGNSGGAVGQAANGLDLFGVNLTGASSVTATGGNAGGLLGDFNATDTDSHLSINALIDSSGTKKKVINYSSVGDKDSGAITVNSTDNNKAAGGLVGAITKGYPQIDNSFSTARVTGYTAGGLIGAVGSSCNANSYVNSCYVGGHVINDTTSGMPVYDKESFNITGTKFAGGFIGSSTFDNLNVSNSYTTASAQATAPDGKAGGFYGSGADITITNCYATGLVKASDSTKAGAFSGTAIAAASANNHYFELINPNMSAVVDQTQVTGVSAVESSLDSYTKFFMLRSEGTFFPYNNSDDTNITSLKRMFGTRYFLPTVHDLDGSATLTTHVGDWQPVDTLVFNTKNSS